MKEDQVKITYPCGCNYEVSGYVESERNRWYSSAYESKLCTTHGEQVRSKAIKSLEKYMEEEHNTMQSLEWNEVKPKRAPKYVKLK